jgi:hypothetical protein
MLFAHLKRILRLGRLRLRGPRGAQFEFTFAAIAQNLRRLAKLTGVTDKIPSRIRHLVYLDSLVLENGQSPFSVLPPNVVAARRKLVAEQG